MRSSGPTILALLCLSLAEKVVAQQTTLNMSHDLVTLGIASQNLTPNDPSLDARPLIQAAANYAKTHTIQTLTVDQGNYYLSSTTYPSATLIFPMLSNMTVDFAGSTIYFMGPMLPNGIEVYECSNFTLTNFSTDFVNPPYTHIKVTSVDAANRLLHYQIIADWPDPATFNNLESPFGDTVANWVAVFRNGAIVPGTTRTLLTGPIENNTLTLAQDETPWTQSATLSTLQPGDTIVVTARGSGPPLLVWESSSVTLSNINIYGSPTWAVEVYASTNSTVDSLHVMPRPGSGLIGSNADGIHFVSIRQNDIIRNSYVTRTMDDALIMDNLFAASVVSQNSPTQLRVMRDIYLRFPNGTAVNFVDPATTEEVTGATIISQDPPDSDSPAFSGQVTLTFNSNLPTITPGMVMVYASPTMRGQGSIIEDNTVEDTYGGRGIWIPGVEGITVQRNVLRRTSLAGIIAYQEMDAAVDSVGLGAPAHNVVINSNALEGALGPAAPGTGVEDSLAAITVESSDNQQFGFAPAASNSNISITNNYIADSGVSGIWVGELDGGTIENNLVIRYSRDPVLGALYGIPPPFQSEVARDVLIPIVLDSTSTGVTELGNTASSASPITAPITMQPPTAAAPSVAGSGSLAVQTAVPNFAWNAVSDSTWLTITSGGSGTGAGTVQFTTTANTSGAARTGNITIAGEAFTLLQTAQATFTNPVLLVTSTHAGSFMQGQQGAAYTVTVSNAAGTTPTSGTVTVTETVPVGLTVAQMSGAGWNCGGICTRSDSLSAGMSYPPVTVLVNVAPNAASQAIDQVSVSGGGSASASASDPTTVTTASNIPAINSGGVVPIYSAVSTIQSGEWVSIYGTNLATSIALYSGSLPYPTSLGGATVMIDGKPAFLYYASPTLIDLIAPADTATGSVAVAVTTANGTADATVTLAQFGPSFFLLDSTHVAGIILRTNGSGSRGGGTYDFLGPTGSSLGYATVAAKEGDVIELFANGLGPTNPAVAAGHGSSGAAPTTNSVTLLINNVSVTPSYAGASSEIGIYQINLTIPAGLGTGDVPLVASVGELQTPSTVVISLQ